MAVPTPGISNDPLLWLLTAASLLSAALYVLRSRPRQSISIPPSTAPSRPAITPRKSNGLIQQRPTTPKEASPVKMNEIVVSKILVHPIKSCRGTSVTKSRYTPSGLENDRKWCIIDAQTHQILTARETPKMVLIVPRLMYDMTSPCSGQLVVSVPKGDDYITFSLPIEPTPEILDSWTIIEECVMFGTYKIDGYVCATLNPEEPSPSEILSEYIGKDVHLVMKGPTPRQCPPTSTFPDLDANAEFQDGYPLLVASEESLGAVAAAIKTASSSASPDGRKIGGLDRDRWKDEDIEIERFRPNIVLKGAEKPFAEDMWQKIAIGPKHDTRLRQKEVMAVTLVSKCTRCLLPNVDPKTGTRDAAVPYKVLMKFRTGVDPVHRNKPCFGCNGVPEGYGTVQVGDFVTVVAHAETST